MGARGDGEPSAIATAALAVAEERTVVAARLVAAANLGKTGAMLARRAACGHGATTSEEHRAHIEAWLAVLGPLAERLRASGLDEACTGACLVYAVDTAFGARWSSSAASEAGAARALERVEAAIEFALARHEERDEYGDPYRCGELGDEFRYRGRKRPAELAEERRAAAALAVRAAWDAALAQGRGERAALEGALAAALPFDATT